MNRKKITYAFFVLLLVTVCLLAYALAVLPHYPGMPHECRGDGCFVCLCCSLCERLAGFVAAIAILGLAFPLAQCAKTNVYSEAECTYAVRTPVFLKVKLSD